MKLQREQLEKMIPEKEVYRSGSPLSQIEKSIYNKARQDIIDKLCGMEIVVNEEKLKECIFDEIINIPNPDNLNMTIVLRTPLLENISKYISQSDCLTLEDK